MIRRLFAIDQRILPLTIFASLGLTLVACGSSSPATGTGGRGDAGPAVGGRDGGTDMRTSAGGSSMGGAGGNPACQAPQYTHVSGFGAILDGWVVATNSTPPSLAPMPGLDGGPPTGTKVEIDPSDGSPVAGSVKLTIPFANTNEEMLFAQNSNGLNMAGTTVTARIKLNSGLNTTPVDVGRAFLILKSTSAYVYAAGTAVSLDSSADWVTLTINSDVPGATVLPGYDPCDIREIAVSVQTASQGTFTTAVVHIDTIAVSAPGIDAGSGDAPPASDAADAPAADAPVDAPALDAPALDAPATDAPVDAATD